MKYQLKVQNLWRLTLLIVEDGGVNEKSPITPFLIILATGSVFIVGCCLFKFSGFIYEWNHNSIETLKNIDKFYKSDKDVARITEVLTGDWDRVCFLHRHETTELKKTLNRDLTVAEILFWNFRVDFVDFDYEGGVFVYEKDGHIQKIEHPGAGFATNKFIGCYQAKSAYLFKNSQQNLGFRAY